MLKEIFTRKGATQAWITGLIGFLLVGLNAFMAGVSFANGNPIGWLSLGVTAFLVCAFIFSLQALRDIAWLMGSTDAYQEMTFRRTSGITR